MTITKRGMLVGVGCVAAMGCAFDAALPGDLDGSADMPAAAEDVGSVQSAVLTWMSGPFGISAAGWHDERVLMPTATHVCTLSKLSGQFLSEAEEVRVIRSNENWVLQAFSGGAPVSGEARCYRKDGFTGLDSTRFISSQQSVHPWTRILSSGPQTGCQQEADNALSGSAFTFINGLGGDLAGGGEWVRVEQSTVDTQPSILRGQTCAPGESLHGSSHSFRVGPTYNRIATFYTTDDRWGDATSSNTVFSASGTQRVVMAKTQFTMCAFTEIKGKFFGGGESVKISNEMVDGYERWVLTTHKLSGSDHVSAKARCFARVQTT